MTVPETGDPFGVGPPGTAPVQLQPAPVPPSPPPDDDVDEEPDDEVGPDEEPDEAPDEPEDEDPDEPEPEPEDEDPDVVPDDDPDPDEPLALPDDPPLLEAAPASTESVDASPHAAPHPTATAAAMRGGATRRCTMTNRRVVCARFTMESSSW